MNQIELKEEILEVEILEYPEKEKFVDLYTSDPEEDFMANNNRTQEGLSLAGTKKDKIAADKPQWTSVWVTNRGAIKSENSGQKLKESTPSTKPPRVQSKMGQEPCICEICFITLSHMGNLKRHMRCHSGDKPFTCPVCNSKFSRNHHLQKHMSTHTREKPFSCEICDFTSATKENLKTHIKTHTDEKPFKCGICDYQCRRKGNLDYHIKSHMGEKLFACELCDAQFLHKSNLKSHILNHSKVKHYNCDVCVYKGTSAKYFKRHLESLGHLTQVRNTK